MATTYLYLDIDGILNKHDTLPNGYNTIYLDKMQLLNRIVANTKCRIVLVSAWRYLILNGQMTLIGFSSLLLTYGLTDSNYICGYIEEDFAVDNKNDRALNILKYRKDNLIEDCKYLVLDDLDLGYTALGLPWYSVDGSIGIVEEDVEKITKELLGGST